MIFKTVQIDSLIIWFHVISIIPFHLKKKPTSWMPWQVIDRISPSEIIKGVYHVSRNQHVPALTVNAWGLAQIAARSTANGTDGLMLDWTSQNTPGSLEFRPSEFKIS